MSSSKFHNSALAAHLASVTGLSVTLTTTGGGSPAIEARPVGTLLGEGPHILILRPTDVDAPLDHAGEYVHGVVVVAYDGTDDDQPTILLEVGVGRAALMGRKEMDGWIAEVLISWRDAQPKPAHADDEPVLTDADVVDAIATLYGTSAEWDTDVEMLVVGLIAKVRPNPGDTTTAAQYRERFLATTGRPVPAEWDASGETVGE